MTLQNRARNLLTRRRQQQQNRRSSLLERSGQEVTCQEFRPQNVNQ